MAERQAGSIPFSADYFDYGQNRLPPAFHMGFAGFRILYPLNKPGDELGVFLGASYFRFLCRQAVYGLSARGLAIDTAQPDARGVPRFRGILGRAAGADPTPHRD